MPSLQLIFGGLSAQMAPTGFAAGNEDLGKCAGRLCRIEVKEFLGGEAKPVSLSELIKFGTSDDGEITARSKEAARCVEAECLPAWGEKDALKGRLDVELGASPAKTESNEA